MASPPSVVKLSLEAICILLGENVGTDWKAIRGVIVKDDFMSRMLTFNTEENVTPAILNTMQKYLDNPDFEFEKVGQLWSLIVLLLGQSSKSSMWTNG